MHLPRVLSQNAWLATAPPTPPYLVRMLPTPPPVQHAVIHIELRCGSSINLGPGVRARPGLPLAGETMVQLPVKFGRVDVSLAASSTLESIAEAANTLHNRENCAELPLAEPPILLHQLGRKSAWLCKQLLFCFACMIEVAVLQDGPRGDGGGDAGAGSANEGRNAVAGRRPSRVTLQGRLEQQQQQGGERKRELSLRVRSVIITRGLYTPLSDVLHLAGPLRCNHRVVVRLRHIEAWRQDPYAWLHRAPRRLWRLAAPTGSWAYINFLLVFCGT